MAPPEADDELPPVAVEAAVVFLALLTLGARLWVEVGPLLRGTAWLLLLSAGAVAHAWWRAHRPRSPEWDSPFPLAIGPLAVASAAVTLAVLAARFLPVWQWDSIGYHLPVVNALLQGGIHDLPADDAYIVAYPHGGELLFAVWRALFSDDRWIDLAQLPLALLGATAITSLARTAGAGRGAAIAAGALWLATPAVFLQLPTDYVDIVAAAYFLAGAALVLAPPSPRRLLVACVAIGLYLGTKPSTPPSAALLLVVAAVRAARAVRPVALVVGGGLTLVTGGESYLRNLAAHHNPIWPVALDVGPLHLPGLHSVAELLAAGAAVPRLHVAQPWRTLLSWAALDAPPAYDMRYGGFGPLFLPALLLLGVWVVRRRAWAWAAAAAAVLLVADPSQARYTLALPGIALAGAAATVSTLRPRTALVLVSAGAGVALVFLMTSARALTGDGPPLAAYPGMSDADRARAVGPCGSPGPFLDARDQLAAGEAAAYDGHFELSYYLWRSDLANRVVRVPDRASADEARALFERRHVALVVAGDGTASAAVVGADPARWRYLFRCPVDDCGVYARR